MTLYLLRQIDQINVNNADRHKTLHVKIIFDSYGFHIIEANIAMKILHALLQHK